MIEPNGQQLVTHISRWDLRWRLAQLATWVPRGVLAGLIVVLSPLGSVLGFAPLPPLFFAVLVLMVITYLAMVQFVKQRFFEASGWRAA